LAQQQTSCKHEVASISYGQQQARTRWNTQASGEVFDQKKKTYLTEQAQKFLSQQSFCVLGGLDAQNKLDGLLVMEQVGFVQTIGDSACLIRLSGSFASSRLIQRMRYQSPSGQLTQLGLFFIHHPTRERLCVHGTAEIMQVVSSPYFSSDPLPSSIWAMLHVEQAFFHCTKYVRTRIAGLTSSAVPPTAHLWERDKLACCDQQRLSQEIQAFIAGQLLCYLCTVDHSGKCAINHRGGAPGFLLTLPPDEQSPGGVVILPDYAGNGAFEAIGNIFETAQASIIIPDFVAQVALKIFGTAQVLEMEQLPSALHQKCKGAERVIAISVQRVEGQGGDWTTALRHEQRRAALNGTTDSALDICPSSS
jgi:hypothetical protein